MMFSTEPPSVRQLSSSPRANEETANLRFATMAFSSSSFRSFFAAWDTNALGEVLQLVEIPIAVLEVAQRHCRREGVGHTAQPTSSATTYEGRWQFRSPAMQSHVTDTGRTASPVYRSGARAACLSRSQPGTVAPRARRTGPRTVRLSG